ncbi:SulP family inorganic anion transporter [Orrella daihaiensis]|uniref:STAS domain-containing protein n=1 Tax=Orrella daihaiensis TaxID=2782176 RepID=A0ABY4AHW7_9BURK|nr:SulP family inorganic anion transporter [Orrella daihaiensis]UOD49779.1 STAS domain-containing protein [Orrella daihaiensis]
MKPNLFPWLKDVRLNSATLTGDMSAAVVVTLMLIPQSLAYALLAGMPAHIGLYASVLPLIGYALLGRSPALAVGPVAIASVMTFDALMPFFTPGSPEWVAGGMFLALASGLILIVFGFLRFGFIAALLSHPVMSGFVSGAAILIILGQIKTLTGIQVTGGTAFDQLQQLMTNLHNVNTITLSVGLCTFVLLLLARRFAGMWLKRVGVRGLVLDILTKASPLVMIGIVTLVLVAMDLENATKTVGSVPTGLPILALPPMSSAYSGLVISALLIGVVGFIESVSMARAIGRIRKVPTDPDAELRGLGAANVLSGLSGAFPVTGGLSRSVVNLDAGARTPLAGVFSAILMVIVLLGAGQYLAALPLASLAALIIVAIWSLFDWRTLRECIRFDRADAAGWLVTFFGVLSLGVEHGIMLGIALSVGTVLWRQSRPHIAIIGRLPGSEHFRNVHRHQVETLSNALFLRVDANLFFANWDRVREFIDQQTNHLTQGGEVVLSMASVSDIDSTALEGLQGLARDLKTREIGLSLCEIKGPISDKLKRAHLDGQVNTHLSNHDAFEAIRAKGHALNSPNI